MIGFLIAFIVLVAVIYCIRLLLPMLGLPEPISTVVLIIIGIIGLLYLVNMLGATGFPHISLR